MATLDRSQSAAGQFAAERFRLALDLAVEGKSPYPNEAAFLAADLPNLGSILAEYAKERRPVVLVYPDGEERILIPEPAAPAAA
jgi:hypothetical protein